MSTYTASFEVPVMVGSAIAENQRALIPFLDPGSPTSIFRAVQADRSLGGLDVDAHVTGAPRRLTFDEVATYKAWGQVVLVQVLVGSGTSLQDVIDGLVARLDTIDGLSVTGFVPGQANFPAAFIVPPTGLDYDDLAEDE